MNLKFMKKYIHNYWKGFCLALVCLSVEALCDLMQPAIMSKIVDIGVANEQMDYVIKNGIIMLVITGIGALGASGRNILSGNVSQKFSMELRSDLFEKIQNFSFASVDRFDSSSLITRLTNDVVQVQNFVNGLMRIFVKAPLICIGSIIMASRLDMHLSRIIYIVIPTVGILIFASMNIGYPYFIKVQNALDRVNSFIREYLSAVRVVKAFDRFDYEVDRFEDANVNLGQSSARAMRIMAVFSPSINLTINIGIVLVLWIGGRYVEGGSMHVGQIIAFINYMTQILFSIMIISSVFNMFVRFRASIIRIAEVFEEKTEFVSGRKSTDHSEIGRIDFENVSFSYQDGHKVIHDISFTCMPGETIGIIGSTGSGKSSLVNLIPRFYDAISGNIKIDGTDVKDIDERILRDKIALVPQKSMLFTGSVLENIRWGKEDASEEEVKKVSKIAEVDEFISKLPEKYNTKLGQEGVNFSGGQKQRVSIARALIKKPEILILDDCTSALDASTEAKIISGIKKYSKDMTVIIIAQKISSIVAADRIIVLDNGKIAGMGSHDDLMKSCEVYKYIYLSQLGKKEA
ncbi:ABC transporter ATP-binding protein [Clostridium sp. LBM24168]